MKYLMLLVILSFALHPAYATTLPEPASLSLIAASFLGFALTRRQARLVNIKSKL